MIFFILNASLNYYLKINLVKFFYIKLYARNANLL